MDNTCRFCGSEEHAPGDPTTWCEEARHSSRAALDRIALFVMFPEPQRMSAPAPWFSPSNVDYLDEIVGALYGAGEALMG